MPQDLKSYIADIRRQTALTEREWYWKGNAHRPKILAYALEYEPFTLLLKVRQYVQRRQKLAPLTFSHKASGKLLNPKDFKLFRDPGRENSFEIETPDGLDAAPCATGGVEMDRAPALSSGNRKLIILHAFYADEAAAIFEKLRAFTDYDLMLTTPIPAIRDQFLDQFDPGRAVCFLIPNSGRDVLPFLLLLAFADVSAYPHFIKIHTKRSLHARNGSGWFSSNVETLIGQKQMTDELLQLIDPQIPAIYGLECLPLRDHFRCNRHWLHALIPGHLNGGCFIPGTMFAGSGAFLRSLAALQLHLHQFEPETGQLDGCLVHALERYFGYYASANGGVCGTFDLLMSQAYERSNR
jgi:hypothetical protein